ncbi:Ig-like domain-containing protein [Clostridium sp. JS66]|uniref:Ig-like domain-containing protein n=1 Tax=Clostridium sp. JS66 TaxID=3064705 RepID=UPI00298E9CB0|nr:Ig-like domain-containing protein [Clostridium sp. JS66]WPC40935.1 Ig-like domain-containing protein [Clostridium sp. JS66]
MNKFYKKLSIIFVMTFAIMIGCFSNVFAADSTNYVPKKDYSSNLVAKWIFDDTNSDYVKGNIAKDLSGKGNDLTMNNITFQNDTDLGRCAYFNGTNAFMEASNPIIPLGKKSIIIKFKVSEVINQPYFSIFSTRRRVNNKWTGVLFGADIDSKVLGSNFSNKFFWEIDNGDGINVFTSTVSNEQFKIGKKYEELLTYNSTDTNMSVNNLNLFESIPYNGTSSKATEITDKNLMANFVIGKDLATDPVKFKGYIQSIEIYNDVVEYEAKATAISLDKTSLDLPVGDTHNLVATITPDNATNKKITWTSDKPDIATVDENGKVTAIKEGIATITATIDGTNISTSCTVTVTPKGTTPTNPDNTGNAILTITMTNGNVKSYTVPMSKVNDFISWYDNRVSGSTGKAYYTFDKTDNLQPFSKKTEYLVFDKISSFEVDEYSK